MDLFILGPLLAVTFQAWAECYGIYGVLKWDGAKPMISFLRGIEGPRRNGTRSEPFQHLRKQRLLARQERIDPKKQKKAVKIATTKG
jgi:hypothetical protein